MSHALRSNGRASSSSTPPVARQAALIPQSLSGSVARMRAGVVTVDDAVRLGWRQGEANDD